MMLAPAKMRALNGDINTDNQYGGGGGGYPGRVAPTAGSDAAPGPPTTMPATTTPTTTDQAAATKTSGLAQSTPRPITAAPTSGPSDATPSVPSGASAITQLPDGAGGAVPIPPASMAPTTVPAFSAPTVANDVNPTNAFDQGILSGQTSNGYNDAPPQNPWETGPSLIPAPTGGAADATPSIPTTPTTMPANTTPDAVARPWDPSSGTFDGENNLIGSQIATPSAKMDTGPSILPAASPRLIGLQGAQDTALSKITGGPDRLALAKNYIAAGDSEYQRTLKDATNAAAEHGYLGSGRLTNQYGDAADRRTQQIDRLLTDASAGTIQDNLNNLGATNSLESNVYGQDASGRGEQRTERGNTQGVNETNYGRTLNDQAALRGERGYQSDQNQLAITRRIQQAAAEQGMTQQDFDNAMRLYGAGNANNPTNAYDNAAATATAEATGSGLTSADLLKLIAQRRNATATPTG
jgi:hypothetical protein